MTAKRKYCAFRVILGIFGVIFIVMMIRIIFVPIGPAHDIPLLANPPAAGSTQFMQTLSQLTNAPVQQGESVQPIESGSDFLPILLNAINTASTSIDFTDYPWNNGSFSDQVFSALTNAAHRDVSVRVLLDALGGHGVPEKLIDQLQTAGGKVAIYNEFSILDPLQFDERDHIRSIVIDGKTAFTGGVGIVDYWISSSTSQGQWHDMMFEVKNQMAEDLQQSFADVWTKTTGEVLTGPVFYPPLDPNIKTNNSFVSITSIPSEDFQPVSDVYMLTALSAQKKLYITNPFIIPDQQFLNVLEEKARAGVDVRILSPGPTTIAQTLRAAWHADYEQLLQAGVKIYEYQPSMIHTKIMIADDTWSVIGSANLDNRSIAINTENVMGIADPVLAAKLDSSFMTDLAQSKQITLADWQKEYGFFSMLYSKLLLILYKQY